MATTTQLMESVERLGLDYRLGRIIEDALAAHEATDKARREHLFSVARRAENYARSIYPESDSGEAAALVLNLPLAPEKPFQPGKKPFAKKTGTPTPAASLAEKRRCKACGTPKDPRAFKGGGNVCTVCQNAGKSPAVAAKPTNGHAGGVKMAPEVRLTEGEMAEYNRGDNVQTARHRALKLMQNLGAQTCRVLSSGGAELEVWHASDLKAAPAGASANTL
jgi:hypothetical protein